MFDFEIAFYLYKISRILEIFEVNKYKARAFYNAAMTIDAYDNFTERAVVNGTLKDLEGIGESSEKIIKEILKTGQCVELKRLEELYRINDYSLILSHGLPSKLIKKLFNGNITSVELLKDALKKEFDTVKLTQAENRLIQDFLCEYEREQGKFLFSYAFCLGNELVSSLNSISGEQIACINFNVWEDKPSYISILCLKGMEERIKTYLLNSNRYADVLSDNNATYCNTVFSLPVQIHFVPKLPKNLSQKDLLGDLHMHTKWSDGKHDIIEMARQAAVLGREYIGITDHSYALKVARGISEVDAIQQIQEISKLKLDGIKVLSGIEVEILKDGTLDFSDEVLSKFDYVIAGIHTFLQQSEMEMQSRLEKALSNPYVNILAHPTGKLLGRPGVIFSGRNSINLPFKKILDICVRNNVAMEINCFPERFDVGIEHFKEMYESGVYLSVGTDSHSAAHLNCLDYAEIMLRNFPNIKPHVINTYPYERLKDFFKTQRKDKDYSAEKIPEKIERHNFEYYFGKNSNISSNNISVIGIDLTGSENKPSGWAVLMGNRAVTKQICSDDDLITESLKYNPKIVSIDSPLSYPEGRCCVKPDCECKKYGITRYCERLMSSFGIHSYPCLIPSMVNLTNRGISLAKKFRDKGVEVIESYPGAAQDILHIRRKQNGLDHLKNSYKNFGIAGDYFSAEKISHDELDAIASALVGLFYLTNQYVGLGNEKENYLIVPSVAEKPKNPIIIGIAGEMAAGKTTLSEYLRFKYGFKYFRYSKVIQQLYACSGDRATLQKIGADIAKNPNTQQQLSLEIIRRVEQEPDFNYVIDGLRHNMDYVTLKEHFGDKFKLIYIDTKFTYCHKRYNKRMHLDMTKEEFERIIYNESEQDIHLMKAYAYSDGYMIGNNKTFKEFFDNFDIKFKEFLCQ
ncbi:MAG: PHP domain-containing protein [Bacilli bacterium]|nr:PHP domain-containing protein [Bacilli bacterium]